MTDTLAHDLVVLHEGVDLCDRQIDQHTSDLGSQIGAANLLDEGEDARTNVLLIAGVLSQDSREDGHGFSEIALGGLVLGVHVHLRCRHHRRSR